MTVAAVNEMFAVADACFMKTLRRLTWRGMMAGDIQDWVTFFRLIETGAARKLIQENSKILN